MSKCFHNEDGVCLLKKGEGGDLPGIVGLDDSRFDCTEDPDTCSLLVLKETAELGKASGFEVESKPGMVKMRRKDPTNPIKEVLYYVHRPKEKGPPNLLAAARGALTGPEWTFDYMTGLCETLTVRRLGVDDHAVISLSSSRKDKPWRLTICGGRHGLPRGRSIRHEKFELAVAEAAKRLNALAKGADGK